MKKFILLSFIAVAIGFTSCANKERCWEIEVSVLGKTVSQFVWGTEKDVDAVIDLMKAEMASDPESAPYADLVKFNKKKSKLSETDCKSKMTEGTDFGM